MLVQKGAISPRSKILLIILGVVIIGGLLVYLFVINAPAPEEESLLNTQTEVIYKTHLVDYNEEIFNDTQLLSLERNKYEGFAKQWPAITLSENIPIMPENINILNPRVGKSLIISWQLPEYINFDLIRIYRSTTLGAKGNIIYETEILPEEAGKNMSFQDDAVVDNITYYYIVKSVISTDEDTEYESDALTELAQQQYQGVATDETPPSAPANVQVQGLADGTIKVAWLNPNESDFSKINIYRSTLKGVTGSLIDGNLYNLTGLSDASNPEVKYFIDDKIVANTMYYYTVTSVDDSGNESSKDLAAAPMKSPLYSPFEPLDF